MTQILLNIENKDILPHLKKILNSIEGVSIAKTTRKNRSGLDIAIEEVKKGEVKYFDKKEDLWKDLGL